MNVKISTHEQLEGVLYTWINDHNDCKIELINENMKRDSIYFISNVLSDSKMVLNLCTGAHSIGNVIDRKDSKALMEWIKNFSEQIILEGANISAEFEDTKEKNSDKLNYRTSYLKAHNETKKRTPMMIVEVGDAMELFSRFLKSDKCTKLIFSFGVHMPDLKRPFRIDFVIDKLYVYFKTLISFSVVRPDIDVYFPDINDAIYEYIPGDNHFMEEINEYCLENLLLIFRRCMNMSDKEIYIYAYSNYDLI